MVILGQEFLTFTQDTVFEQIDNNEDNSTYLHQYSGDTPYLLELNRVPKRYVTKFEDDGVLNICFGPVYHQMAMKK